MVYVSTSCLRDGENRFTKDIFRVLDVYGKLGIQDIELGSTHSYIGDLTPLFSFQREHNANFVIHGFFPPTKEQVILNFASQTNVLKKSMEIAKQALEFCRKLNSRLYSCHGGYLADLDLDFNPIQPLMSYEQAFDTVKHSIAELVDYASSYDIKVAIEKISYADDVMFYHYNHFLHLFEEVNQKNLGILLDVGHLDKDCSKGLFTKKEFIEKVKHKIFELHVHQVVGQKDHFNVTDENILKDFDKETIEKAAVTLEANMLTAEEVAQGKEVLERGVGKVVYQGSRWQ
jgi:sugar phosphate isomerase/epimerase